MKDKNYWNIDFESRTLADKFQLKCKDYSIITIRLDEIRVAVYTKGSPMTQLKAYYRFKEVMENK